jgi:hypothetical protein
MKRVIKELKDRRSLLEKRIETCTEMLKPLEKEVESKKMHISEASLEIKEIDVSLRILEKIEK